MKLYKVGILGATGAVGREMMKILAERQFPISELRLFASSRSAGKVVEWNGRPVMIQEQVLRTLIHGSGLTLAIPN